MIKRNSLGQYEKGGHRTKIEKKKIGDFFRNKPLSIKHKEKLSIANKGKFTGSESHNWKGDNICKRVIHYRIEKILGKPKYCEVCKSSTKKRYEWSNKNHKYSLNVKYWQRLCCSCHQKYDYKFNLKYKKI
jgi:hypothetical protein